MIAKNPVRTKFLLLNSTVHKLEIEFDMLDRACWRSHGWRRYCPIGMAM